MEKGEDNLGILIRNMSPVLDSRTFVFVHIPNDVTPPEYLKARAIMVFVEDEGLTCIVERDKAERLGVSFNFPSKKITLNIHSSLDAVGFLAHIIPKLAALGMGVNPVAGYFHDHLFVPEAFATEAMKCLHKLIEDAR